MSTSDFGVTVRIGQDPAADADFIDDFATMSSFGATAAGGVERQAATAADAENRRWLASWLEARGFTVAYDRIGNMFGLCELVPGAPYVLAGSHLDSQPRGGRFDGAYGVLAAAHTMDRLRRYYLANPDRAVHNLAVINWFNEEGSASSRRCRGAACSPARSTCSPRSAPPMPPASRWPRLWVSWTCWVRRRLHDRRAPHAGRLECRLVRGDPHRTGT